MAGVRCAMSAAGLALLLGLGAAGAAPPEEKLTGPSREFLIQSAMGSLAEIRMGQLAVERGVDEAVKRFGKRMVEDHGKANMELSSLAKEKGVPLPPDMGPEHKVTVAKLAALTGSPFDRAYAAAMVAGHAKTIGEFEKETARGEDPVLRAWASKQLPVLRRHLRSARELAAKVGEPEKDPKAGK